MMASRENKNEESSSEVESDDEQKSKGSDEEEEEDPCRCHLTTYRKRKKQEAQPSPSAKTSSDSNISYPKIQKLAISEENNFISGKFKDFGDFMKELLKLDTSICLTLRDCCIETLGDEVVPLKLAFKHIAFKNCNDNVYKVFRNRTASVTIKVQTDKFDGFPFKVTKLETSMITFYWYVGLKAARINFLESQKGFLKELTIHELPYDFEGGQVLEHIIEKMNLKTFYYGKIPLILNGKKQDVKEFAASEIQITSAFEMVKQFPSIEKFTLKISNIDISSEDIKKALDSASVFSNLKELVVIDKSRGSLGVFLGLFKNLNNLQILTLDTKSICINSILRCFPTMDSLQKIQLTSTASNAIARYKTIQDFAKNLKVIRVEKSCANDAYIVFGDKVEFSDLDIGNAPGGSNTQRSDDGTENNREGGRGNDDGDDKKDDDVKEESEPQSTLSEYPIITPKNRDFPFQSSFADHDIYEAAKFFIHACGHAKNILSENNLEELFKLIEKEEFADHFNVFNIETGKIVIEFPNNENGYPNQLKNKIDKLAYQINEKVQLPLLTLINNFPVKIECKVSNMEWDDFLTAVRRYNKGISASLWTTNDSSSNGPFTIKVDAISYYEIKKRGLNIAGTACDIVEVENRYKFDVAKFDDLSI